jgi:hypothetical protein
MGNVKHRGAENFSTEPQRVTNRFVSLRTLCPLSLCGENVFLPSDLRRHHYYMRDGALDIFPIVRVKCNLLSYATRSQQFGQPIVIFSYLHIRVGI